MAYEDPVKRAEREMAELETLMNRGEQDRPDNQTDTGATADPEGTRDTDQEQAAQVTDQEQTVQPELGAKYAALEQRHNTLLGKYNAEVPRLRAENTQLNEQVKRLMNQIQEMGKAATVDSTDEADTYVSPFVTAEDRSTRAYQMMLKDFGQRYAEMHFEAAAERTQRETRPLREENAQNAKASFHSSIALLAPNWLLLNDDPGFIAWSNSVTEPYSGKTMNQLLNESYHGGNAASVARIFNQYESDTSTPDKTDPRTSAQMSMVQPPKRGSATGTGIDAMKGDVITHAEAMQALDDIGAGRIKGQAAKDLEAKITKAYADGKVV